MSNKKLLDSRHHKYTGPFYPPSLARIQRAYETRRFKAHPVTEELLRAFAADLGMISPDTKFEDNFETFDEHGTKTVWYAVRIRHPSGVSYKVAFPKEFDPDHKDGHVSTHHVALYYFFDEDVSDDDLERAARTADTFFEMARPNFR